MNRSGGLKLVIVIGVIVIVVVATFIYGNIQRNKQKPAGPANLPTIENTDQAKSAEQNKSDQAANNKPTESKPQQSSQNNQAAPAPSSGEPAPGPINQSKPAQAQIPTAHTPATGAADMLIPALVLGLLSGGYIITKRQRRLHIESLQRRSNQI